jgi:transcription elongation factor GreB
VSGTLKDGFKNTVRPAGHRRLPEGLARVWKVERPAVVGTVAWAASNGGRSENDDYIYGKRKLREIDRRIRHLSKSLDSAVVIDNVGRAPDRGFFGATVAACPVCLNHDRPEATRDVFVR